MPGRTVSMMPPRRPACGYLQSSQGAGLAEPGKYPKRSAARPHSPSVKQESRLYGPSRPGDRDLRSFVAREARPVSSFRQPDSAALTSTGLATFTLAGHAKTHFENSLSSLLTQGRKDLTSPKKHMQRAVTGNFAEGRDGDFRRGTLIIEAAENSPSPLPKHFPDFVMASTSS